MFDNLDPSVRDRLKSYDEQSGEVLNKFEQLLLMLTINRLQNMQILMVTGVISRLGNPHKKTL
ncbi:hypothetical protein FRC0190_01085 [Corynebacterium rouxii]|uniref:Uncharacterized protein n=1 Tax=Corynebacterium rouxii TaxID=2719119 RepID=A0A6I8MFL2_9CORY|nr:hypothetical protein FRC0190_01085 [Corynebacterium rouxii]